jgi:RNA polymerase sigma-70 factor (ECF subfamily)
VSQTTPAPDDWGPDLAAAQAGSREARERLVRAWQFFLRLVARRAMGDDLKARCGESDLVQMTLLDAQRGLDRFRGDGGRLRPWLRRILRNNLCNLRRSLRPVALREVPLGRDPDGSSAGGLAAREPTPSHLLAQNECLDALRGAIDRLPEDYRTVILLRHQQRLPFEEVAGRMGRSADATRRLWLRAVQRLRHEMGPLGDA